MANRKVVLLIDNFAAHESAVKDLQQRPLGLRNTEVLFLPPNTTSRLQPLDQGIIRTFKAVYRRKWLRYMIDEHADGRNPFNSVNILKAIRWSIQAWHELDKDTIANCWIHSGVNGPVQKALTRQAFNQACKKAAINPFDSSALYKLAEHLQRTSLQPPPPPPLPIDPDTIQEI